MVIDGPARQRHEHATRVADLCGTNGIAIDANGIGRRDKQLIANQRHAER